MAALCSMSGSDRLSSMGTGCCASCRVEVGLEGWYKEGLEGAGVPLEMVVLSSNRSSHLLHSA